MRIKEAVGDFCRKSRYELQEYVIRDGKRHPFALRKSETPYYKRIEECDYSSCGLFDYVMDAESVLSTPSVKSGYCNSFFKVIKWQTGDAFSGKRE